MTYDTVATFSQVASLLLFIVLFVAVIVYVLMPKSKERLERAQRSALDLDTAPDRQKGH